MHITKKRKRVLSVVAVALCVVLALAIMQWMRIHKRPESVACPGCNVLLISLDTCAAEHFSCYGNQQGTTPNFCAFADNNIKFNDAVANATWTLPSHVSIMTGLDVANHGIDTPRRQLSPTVPFLPEIMKKAGYETVFYIPENDFSLPIREVYSRGIDKVDYVDYGTPGYFARAIGQLKKNSQRGKKTFMFFHTYKCHAPYLIQGNKPKYTNLIFPEIPLTIEQMLGSYTPAFYAHVYENLPSAIADNSFGTKTEKMVKLYGLMSETGPIATRLEFERLLKAADLKLEDLWLQYYDFFYNARIDQNNPKHMEYLSALYDQSLNELDASMGAELLKLINEPQVKDNTIVIVTSDHGEEFNEHGYMGHVSVYDQNALVPLFMRVPNVVKRSVTLPVQSTDLVPTILDLVGVKNAYKFDGRSLVPAIRGEGLSDRMRVIEGLSNSQGRTMALYESDWKLHVTVSFDGSKIIPTQLFNRKSDPAETHNVLWSELDVAKRMISDFRTLK